MRPFRSLLIAACVGLVAACAPPPPPVIDATAMTVDGVRVDPSHEIEPGLLREALASYASHYGTVTEETKIFNLPEKKIESEVSPIRRDVMGVVDFRIPATQPRFFIVDFKTGGVSAYRVAHGRKSDALGAPDLQGRLLTAGPAVRASNLLDSNESPVGAFVAANTYDNGYWPGSMRLHGLDATNSCTFYRAVVLHQMEYMTPNATGQVGTSDGCFAVETSSRPTITAFLKDGGFLYAGPVSLHVPSPADGQTTQAACEAVRLKPELGPQALPPPPGA